MTNPKDNMLVRARVDETDDSGKQQRQVLRGRKREKLGGASHKTATVRLHGHTSVPWKDSHGMLVMIGGNPDQAFMLGGEHPDKRLKNLSDGDSALYRDTERYIHITEDGIFISHPGDVTVVANGDVNITGLGRVHLNPPGQMTVRATGSAATLTKSP